jgi:hypothetical protein
VIDNRIVKGDASVGNTLGWKALGRQVLADSSEQERRGVEAGCVKERNADGREALRGMVRTGPDPTVPPDNSTGRVMLSIVNYIIYNSND